MKISHAFACSVFALFAFLSCKKKDPSNSHAAVKLNNDPADLRLVISAKPFTVSSGLGLVVDRANQSLKFEALIKILGEKCPAEMLSILEKTGQSFPELNGKMGIGWKIYALNSHEDGGLTVHVLDGSLAAFGYSFKAPEAQHADKMETFFLSSFVFDGESKINVLNENFDEIPMLVKKFTNQTNRVLQALSYAKGLNHTLAFYDSSRVDASKLLPAAAGTVDPELIRQMKAMIEPAKNGSSPK